MLDGDLRRIKLAYSVLFSLPGTPVLFYGEEIGLGENLKAEGRMAVRVPMQWSASAAGSRPDPKTPGRRRRASSARSTSTCATSAATRTRCCGHRC